MVVLGISISTRRNGIAVVEGNELKAALIRSRCERWSPQKIHYFIRIYKRYIRLYGVTTVVIKIPRPSHFSLALKQLIQAVDEYVKKQGCLIAYTTIEEIKQRVPSIKNRNELRKFAVSQYPELINELNKDRRNRQPYYMRMFEATIIAHIESNRVREE
jgi:hypothetical protein